MMRTFVSMVALFMGGALLLAGCASLSGSAPIAGTNASHEQWMTTGPSGTPGELPVGVSSGD